MNDEARAKAAQLRAWLPGWVKQPAADPILDGLLRVWASVQTLVARQRRNLTQLRAAEDCPPRQLPGLGALVGFDRATRVSRLFDEAGWRRAIPTAGRVWRTVRMLDGVRDVVVSATARPAAVGDWHAMKDVLDEGANPYTGLPAPPAFGALGTIWVRASDPNNDADRRALTEAYLHDTRPLKAAFVLVWLRLVETWTQGSWQWTDAGEVAHQVDATARRLDLPPGAAVHYEVAHAWPRARAWVHVPEGATADLGMRGGELVARLEATGAHQVRVSVLDENGNAVAGPVTRPWDTSSPRELLVTIEEAVGGELARVDLDGDLALAAVVTGGWSATGIRLATPAASAAATSWHYVESSDGPPTIVNIGPSAA